MSARLVGSLAHLPFMRCPNYTRRVNNKWNWSHPRGQHFRNILFRRFTRQIRTGAGRLLLLAVLLAGCAPAGQEGSPVQEQTLSIFAAASLTDAFNEIGTSFEAANPGVTVTFNFAGSQALTTQIEEGSARGCIRFCQYEGNG